MLLSELHGYKQYLGKSLNKVLADFCEKHDIRIASGGFGFVIKSSKPYVYKLWVEDPAWEGWLKYSKEHPSKYFVKQLSSVKQLRLDMTVVGGSPKSKDRVKKAQDSGKPVVLKYIKLEKLTHINGPLADIIADAYPVVKEMVRKGRKYTIAELAHLVSELGSVVEQDVIDNGKFFETYMDVGIEMHKLGYRFDLHTNNVMMRDMTPIITDPAYSDISREAIGAPELVDLFDTEIGRV